MYVHFYDNCFQVVRFHLRHFDRQRERETLVAWKDLFLAWKFWKSFQHGEWEWQRSEESFCSFSNSDPRRTQVVLHCLLRDKIVTKSFFAFKQERGQRRGGMRSINRDINRSRIIFEQQVFRLSRQLVDELAKKWRRRRGTNVSFLEVACRRGANRKSIRQKQHENERKGVNVVNVVNWVIINLQFSTDPASAEASGANASSSLSSSSSVLEDSSISLPAKMNRILCLDMPSSWSKHSDLSSSRSRSRRLEVSMALSLAPLMTEKTWFSISWRSLMKYPRGWSSWSRSNSLVEPETNSLLSSFTSSFFSFLFAFTVVVLALLQPPSLWWFHAPTPLPHRGHDWFLGSNLREREKKKWSTYIKSLFSQ